MAELFNTAIEIVIDMIHPEIHPLAKIAKDIAAGAVLIAAMAAFLVGCILFYTRLL
ncbi:Diacylglycerol kinase [bioreactor metagenome]|uniref:Diacylglycerol kinase n=1 Tax=bioreactor metagenome TaxID=1076179 RepID=A0A645F788_9ZZZZ